MLTQPARLIALCAAMGMAGCSSSDGPALGTVSGNVTLDGKPIESVQVTFTPIEASSGRPSFGMTDSSGDYELVFSTSNEGAAVGEHRVTIFKPLTIEDMGMDGTTAKDPIPPEYHSRSKLTEVVEEGHNEIDFKLESKQVLSREDHSAKPQQ